jgi:hypothetical protein
MKLERGVKYTPFQHSGIEQEGMPSEVSVVILRGSLLYAYSYPCFLRIQIIGLHEPKRSYSVLTQISTADTSYHRVFVLYSRIIYGCTW